MPINECQHHIKMTVRGGWMCMNCPANENLSRSDRVNLNAIKHEIPESRQWLLKGNDFDASLNRAKEIVEAWPEWKRYL